jgi:four helix bundle protein
MALGQEKPDVYRMAIGHVAWVFKHSEKPNGAHRHTRDQWLRASQSIPLNIAEENGKTAEADRRRYFEIARGSVLECAAIQDVLVVGRVLRRTTVGSGRSPWTGWQRCGADWASVAVRCGKRDRLTGSISIAIPISIPKKQFPNKPALEEGKEI